MIEIIVSGYRWFFLQLANFAGYGMGVVMLSIITSAAMLPLMRAVMGVVRRETEYQNVILPQLESINKQYATDIERNRHIQLLYARYAYSPLYAVKKVLPLLVQIPFLLLTYTMLKGTTQLQGVQFLFLRDLGMPDGLIPGTWFPFLFVSGRGVIGGSEQHLNLLPFLMTGVNLLTSYATLGFSKKDRIQAICIAILFLVMLYGAPSALLLYWTLNNIITLARTLIADRFSGTLLLLHRVGSIPGMIRAKRNALSIGNVAIVSFGALAVAAYCFLTVVMFQSMNDACHGLTYTLSTGGMFHALALSSFAALMLFMREKGIKRYLGCVFCALPIAFAIFITCLFLFAHQLFWKFDLAFNFNTIFVGLFAGMLLPFAVLLASDYSVMRNNLFSIFQVELPLLALPAIFAIHYAYSSEGFHLPVLSVVTLVIYLLLPCIILPVLFSIMFSKWVAPRIVFKGVVGGMIGVYIVPMVSTASGVFAFNNNFFIRLGIILFMAIITVKAAKGLLRVFICCLGVFVITHVAYIQFIRNGNHDSLAGTPLVEPIEKIVASKTNSVYLLIYDGYAHRIVRNALKLDADNPIENALKSHGFTIYDAYTIGSGTVESMSAMFTFGGMCGGSQRSTMAGDNIFSDFLKRSGYRTSYLMCGYSMPNHGERMPGDFYYPKAQAIKRPEDVLMSCILRGYLSQSPQTFNYYTHADWLAEKNKELINHAGEKRFIYAHSNMPDHLCVDPRWRKSDEEGRLKYAPRLKNAHSEIIHDIELLAQLDESAVVVVASDHGGFLLSPDKPGNVDARHLIDRHGVLLAIHWPDDYAPTLQLNCLQNVLLEVMIYLSGDRSLKRYAIDGATHQIRYPISSSPGLVKNAIIQFGQQKGQSLFDAAQALFDVRGAAK